MKKILHGLCLFIFTFLCMGCSSELPEPIREAESLTHLGITYKIVEIDGKKWMASYAGKGCWILGGQIEE